MRVDRATLDDLSILDPDPDGLSVCTLLDRTVTRLGHANLRHRMQELPQSVSQLRHVQDAVHFLSPASQQVRWQLERLNPDAVDAYLNLKWQTTVALGTIAGFVERAELRLRYRDAIRQVSAGVATLAAFLERLPALIETLAPAPGILATYARELRAHCEQHVVEELRRHANASSLGRVLEADRLARKDAALALRRCLAIVAELDALCALARATQEHGWVLPTIVDEAGVVEFRELRHPFVKAATANDLTVESHQRVTAVTGPNMAGKSTTLKAAGIAVYLAHLGCGVPAVQARLSWFDWLIASLHVRDSVGRGESFYLSEVRRIRELVMLLETTTRVFGVLDEPFRGTNVYDATDATTLLLDGLCAQTEATILVATHLASVVQSRANDTAMVAVYLGATQGESGPHFDYVLRRGVSEQRLGLTLLEREGVTAVLRSAMERRNSRAPLD